MRSPRERDSCVSFLIRVHGLYSSEFERVFIVRFSYFLMIILRRFPLSRDPPHTKYRVYDDIIRTAVTSRPTRRLVRTGAGARKSDRRTGREAIRSDRVSYSVYGDDSDFQLPCAAIRSQAVAGLSPPESDGTPSSKR